MQTILFHSTIFGPIHSRRLGVSLGVNLMPADGKICSFDCLYCEAGFNAQGAGKKGLPSREQTARLLEAKLADIQNRGEKLDVITFSGNGEPTLHPEFEGIVDDTITLRNRYFPDAKISVLTNSTRIGDEKVVRALLRVDNNILKLDSAIEDTMKLIDRPNDPAFSASGVIEQLKKFEGTGIIQTMFVRGSHGGQVIDNTTEPELEALIEAYKIIKPKEVMIYSLDRPTPERNLRKVERDELERIAARIRKVGINVQPF